ncbi:MAG: hypothetical protein IJ680_05860 [Paludibacteraceae bacterium]|nr:hypothetical protein [Paludibacteraceae bacterium]
MPDIDSLSINISASTKSATDALDRLIARLGALDKALGRMNTGHFDTSINNAASALYNLSAAAGGLDSSGIRSTASSLETLAKASTSLNDAQAGAQTMQDLAVGIQSIIGASANIGQSASSLMSLATSIKNMGGSNATNASYTLGPIADALRQFENITIPDVTGLSELAAALRSMGTKKMSSAASALPFIADALRQFSNIQLPDVTGISELATAIAKLGYKSVANAAENIPQIATAFRSLIAELQNVPQVSKSTIELANAMGQLAQGSRNINSVLNGPVRTGFSSYTAAAGRARISTLSLATAVAKLRAIFFALRRVFGFLKDAIDYSSQLTEVQNVVDVTFGRNAEKMEQLTQSSIQTLGMNALTAKQIGSRFQAMGSAMGITQTQVGEASEFLADKVHSSYGSIYNDMSDVSIQLTKLAADMASFYNVEQSEVAQDLEAVFTGMTRPLTLAA